MEITENSYVRLKDGRTIYVKQIKSDVYRGVELGNKHFPEVEFTIKEVSHIAMEGRKTI